MRLNFQGPLFILLGLLLVSCYEDDLTNQLKTIGSNEDSQKAKIIEVQYTELEKEVFEDIEKVQKDLSLTLESLDANDLEKEDLNCIRDIIASKLSSFQINERPVGIFPLNSLTANYTSINGAVTIAINSPENYSDILEEDRHDRLKRFMITGFCSSRSFFALSRYFL